MGHNGAQRNEITRIFTTPVHHIIHTKNLQSIVTQTSNKTTDYGIVVGPTHVLHTIDNVFHYYDLPKQQGNKCCKNLTLANLWNIKFKRTTNTYSLRM